MINFMIEHDHELCTSDCPVKQYCILDNIHIFDNTFLDKFYAPFECCTDNKNFESIKLINVLFIGEGPGEFEALNKQPFYPNAPSGKTLRQAIYDLQLNYYAIANIVGCRPVNNVNNKLINRTPFNYECDYCIENLRRFVTLLNPNLTLIALGKTASRSIIARIDKTIDPEKFTATQYVKLNPIHINGKKYASNFHPRYIVSNGGIKSNLYKDYIKTFERILYD